MKLGLARGPHPRNSRIWRTACDVRCPSCGGYYHPSDLRLRINNTRGYAICGNCYHLGGPDGHLEKKR